MIYRHQEMYSDAVTQLAYAEDLPLIPVREEFLNDHKLMRAHRRRRHPFDHARL